jgi:hypothetical protein
MPIIPQEEVCPVPESLLGDLYRAAPASLHALAESIPSQGRAMLAIYCMRRAHLAPLGLALASTCEKNELINSGGALGAAIFAQSREAPDVPLERRRKRVTLSSGSYFSRIVAQDLI